MKIFCISLLLLAALAVPCRAQTTTYSQEIAVRQTLAQRLGEQIKKWEQRKSILERNENEYRRCLAGKADVDRKVKEMQAADSTYDPRNITQELYYAVKASELTKSMGISVAMGQTTVRNYGDLKRWIATYEKDLPQRRRELEQLENDLARARADLARTEKEIAVLKSARSLVAAKAALEGRWMLGGAGNSNLIDVVYNEKDRYFYGMVAKSANLICHQAGAILFSVRPSSGSDTQFIGTEYGYDYDGAAGKCLPVQSKLTITVNGASMAYHNGAQQLVLNRMPAAPAPPSLPMRPPPTREDRRNFDNF